MGEIKDITGDGALTDEETPFVEDIEQDVNQEMADIAAETPDKAPADPTTESAVQITEKTPTPEPNQTQAASKPGRKPQYRPEPATPEEPTQQPQQGRGSSTRSSSPTGPQELIQTGVSFLSGLARTLSSAEETQKLVSSITDRDEKTGQTYLKIPVENEQAVTQALNVLGNLFKAFGGG
jgi:hypothetical protein